MSFSYLPAGLPRPAPEPDGLDAPYWDGLREERLLLQRCRACRHFQWGPEWICHRCHSFDLAFEQTEPDGVVYACERVWHPVHPALAAQGPYLVVLVELPQADGVRVLGNLLGPAEQAVRPGQHVEGVFEHHRDVEPPFTLLQWRAVR